MLHLRKYGFDGFVKRDNAVGKPDVQHRAYRDSVAVLFSVVEAKPAVAVFFRIFVWATVFSPSRCMPPGGVS